MTDTHTTKYGEHAPDWVPVAWIGYEPTQWRCRVCGAVQGEA